MTAEEYIQQAEALRRQLLIMSRRYLGETGDAEDVVQDVMLKLWQMRDSLRSPIDNIALVITRNLCIDLLRRRQPTYDITQLPEEEDFSDDGEQIEQMMKVIDTLPSAQKAILRMRHLEGMEMREIAMVLGSSEVAVRKTLSRARKAVRNKLIALMVAASLLTAVSGTLIYWLKYESENECVAYIHGRKYTDEAVVMKEMQRTMGEMVNDNPSDDIEQQLNDLFSE